MSQQCDQWIVVGKPKRKQIKKQQKIDKLKQGKIIWQMGKPLFTQNNQEAIIAQYLATKCHKANTQLVRSLISERCKKQDKWIIIHIQCLGLGDFIKNAKPRYQFIFLKHLLIPLCEEMCSKLTINCYDPVFSKECIQQAKKLGATIIPDCIPKLEKGQLIILYMPHCQRFLYERYCSAYDNQNVLIIGNSLKQYRERCQLLSQKIPQCLANKKHKEYKVLDFKQSFNDTYCYFI